MLVLYYIGTILAWMLLMRIIRPANLSDVVVIWFLSAFSWVAVVLIALMLILAMATKM